MTEANLGIYSMLRPRKSAFDYFVQGQEAKQNYESNQQMMAARQQAMAQAEQMNPLLIEAQRAGIDLTQQQTSTAGTQQELLQKDVSSYDENLRLERERQQSDIDLNRFNLGTAEQSRPLELEALKQGNTLNKQNIAQNRITLSNAEKQQAADAVQKKVDSYIKLGSVAQSVKSIGPEGSLERSNYVDAISKQIEELGLDIDFEKIKKDGVTDEEIDQVVSLAQGLKSGDANTLELLKLEEQRLKNDKLKSESVAADKKVESTEKENIAKAQNIFSTSDSGIALIDDLVAFDEGVWNDVTGPIEGSKLGEFASSALMQQDEVDFRAKVTQLKAQLSVSNLEKMSGPLTDTDIRILTDAAGNLDLKQSPKQIKATLATIKRTLDQNRTMAAEKYGVKEPIPNTPNVQIDPQELESKYQSLRQQFRHGSR